MEDGLVLFTYNGNKYKVCLNPCCNGRWSRTIETLTQYGNAKRLNPCCNGRWSRTRLYKTILIINKL